MSLESPQLKSPAITPEIKLRAKGTVGSPSATARPVPPRRITSTQ